MHLRTFCAIHVLAGLANKRKDYNEHADMVGDAIGITEVLLDTLGENPSQNVYPASAPLGERSSGGRSRDDKPRGERRGGSGRSSRGGGRGGGGRGREKSEGYWGRMESNYSGECYICGEEYAEGDTIMYHSGQPKFKKAIHVDCHAKEYGEDGD